MASIPLFFIILIQINLIRSLPTGALIDEVLEEDGSDFSIDLTRFGDLIFGDPDETVGRMVDSWSTDSNMNAEEMGTYLEGDILIPNTEGRNGLIKEASMWKNRRIPYVFHSSVSSSDREKILDALNEYHTKTCLKFVPRTNEKDYISFESSNTGCWSSVGRTGGKQSVNLQSGGCTRKGTIIHECMHAVGFLHEQNRYDRDTAVTILHQNIKSDALPNFDKAKFGETTAYDEPYDLGSVMHYSANAFSKNGQKTIIARDTIKEGQMGQRKGFSDSDLRRISNRYCRGIQSVTDKNPSEIDYVGNGIGSGPKEPDYSYPLYPDGPPFYPHGPPFYPEGPPFYPNGPYPQSFAPSFGRPPHRPPFGGPPHRPPFGGPFGRPPVFG